MTKQTATLAGYVAELRYEDIPPEVLERAKVLTLDFLGSAIRARRDAESTPSLLKMLEALALDGKGDSTVFGDTKTFNPAVAALLNGALGHSLDFDDRHLDFRVVVDVAPCDLGRQITATTLVLTHNLLGRLYLASILPFHRLVVRSLMQRAFLPSARG